MRAELVANGERVAMQHDGNTNKATLQVSKDGQYYVSTLFNNDSVKLTDDYLITLVPGQQADREGLEAGPRLAREQHRGGRACASRRATTSASTSSSCATR